MVVKFTQFSKVVLASLEEISIIVTIVKYPDNMSEQYDSLNYKKD